MKASTLLFLGLLLVSGLSAQSLRPADRIDDHRSRGGDFEIATPLAPLNQRGIRVDEMEELGTDYRVAGLRPGEVDRILRTAPASLSLSVPTAEFGEITLQLLRTDILADDFRVIESHTGEVAEVHTGLHYRGVVKERAAQSLVALSFFPGEMMGLISGLNGNYVLGALRGDGFTAGEHIIYRDAELLFRSGFSCDMPDDGYVYSREELEFSGGPGRGLNDCVRIYLEADNDIYQDKGSTAATTSYVTGIFNQMATLYANEQINTELSELKVWSSASPYSSTSSSGMLSDFQASVGNFNGDLAGLFSYQASGGIAAGFAGLCNSNPDNSMCFSSIQSTYSTVPAYSWTVDVVTHEFGHLFGSRHTHACVWNGNGTAIDGCYNTEGGCARPGYPSAGGTIMSYCHLQSVGKDLALGFGPQPGDVIRNSVTNAGCLSACGSGGGGGGGGSSCTDNELTLTIVLDNYPEETSWEVRDGAGTAVASGGTYGAYADGATVTESICLPDGCYTFTIFDSYGDGMCCAYGNGSYSLTDAGGTVLASGGQFGASEASSICVPDSGGGGGGGGDCLTVDFAAYSINSYGGSQDNGTYDLLDNNQTLRIQNNAWKSISLSYTVTPNTVIEFDFGSTVQGEIHGLGFDTDNGISSDRTFRVYGTQNWGIGNYDDYAGSAGYWKSYTIPVGQFYTGTFDRLFFVADHDGGARNGNSFYRNIRIYEGSACGAQPAPGASLTELAGQPEGTGSLLVFPNPSRGSLTVDYSAAQPGTALLEVYNLMGQRLLQQSAATTEGFNRQTIATTQLPTGTYLLQLRVDGELRTVRFSVAR